MPACERLDDRAGVHPCTAHRAWPADHRLFMQYLPNLHCADLQVVQNGGDFGSSAQ